MQPRALRIGALLTALGGLCAAGGWALGTDGGKRFLVATLDQTLNAQGGELPDALEPQFDGPDAARPRLHISLELVADGLPQPTDIQAVPGQPGAVIVLGKQGTAWWVNLDTGNRQVWLTVDVATASELGLLGLAFAPDFERTGTFYLNYTVPGSGRKATTRVERWRVPDPSTPEAGAAALGLVLEQEQPYQNHNGGQLQFGPDGMLYVALGDGGFRNDPKGAGQDRSTWLGSILRLDVSVAPYAVPADNPLVGREGARPEIWVWGVRNPWRLAFLPDGRCAIADVGQNEVEEVSVVGPSGGNLGWRVREGDRCFDEQAMPGCRDPSFIDPVWTYGRDSGVSITGGYPWPGDGPLGGRYVAGDFATGRLWAMSLPPAGEAEVASLGRWPIAPSTFGLDGAGSMLVADFRTGTLLRMVPHAESTE